MLYLDMALNFSTTSSPFSAALDPMDKCHTTLVINENKTQLLSAIMFSSGVIGNVLALIILAIRRRRDMRAGVTWHRALFHILITSLVVTDLTGTCLVSPVVHIAYNVNKTLFGISPETHSACSYFGVAMTFFTMATISLLLITSLEKFFAIGRPYLYSRHVTKKCAYITIPLVFLVCLSFVLLPFTGFGKYVQYCPGTWCFIDMNAERPVDRAFAILYATIMLVLVLCIVTSNSGVMYHLIKMYKRRKTNVSMRMSGRCSIESRQVSLVEEVEQLILLIFMTLVFIMCTLPLVVRVYVNASQIQVESHRRDLMALRLMAFNSILDPWVFILLSPSVLHFCWTSLSQASMMLPMRSWSRASVTKNNVPACQELSRASLSTDKVDAIEKV